MILLDIFTYIIHPLLAITIENCLCKPIYIKTIGCVYVKRLTVSRPIMSGTIEKWLYEHQTYKTFHY